MASVTAHVLLGTPRRYGPGLSPAFIAMFRDAAHPRWQVENIEDENDLPARTVVTAPPDRIALGLAVAIHTAIDSPFLNAIIEPPEGVLDLGALADDTLATIDRTLTQNPAGLSAVVCWMSESLFGPEHADAIVPYLAGDIEACTTVWSQLGSGHDGFGTPGTRTSNPDWSTGT